MANNSQQGTNDRIREKVEKIKQLAREAAKIVVSRQVSSYNGAEVQSLRDAFQEREQEFWQQIEREREEADTKLQRAERERDEAQQQIQVVRTEAEVG